MTRGIGRLTKEPAMGLRMRKSFKIAKGVRLNVSKSGIGVSAGVKGARVSVHSSGRVTKSASIPGTGIGWVESKKIGNSRKQAVAKNPCDFCGNEAIIEATGRLDDAPERSEKFCAVHMAQYLPEEFEKLRKRVGK
jgi:uncharacterized protein DUF4236